MLAAWARAASDRPRPRWALAMTSLKRSSRGIIMRGMWARRGGRCNFECVTEKRLVGRQPYGGEFEEPFLGCDDGFDFWAV